MIKYAIKVVLNCILSNCPAFRGTVLIFGSKFTAVLIILCFVPLFYGIFVHWYAYKFGYFHRILENVLILDQKSRFFKDFVPLLVLDRLVSM